MLAVEECGETSVRGVFVARQPIFDDRSRIFGYELLHRAGHEDGYRSGDADLASLAVISNCVTSGT